MKKKYPTSPAKILDSKSDFNANSPSMNSSQNNLLKNEQYAKN